MKDKTQSKISWVNARETKCESVEVVVAAAMESREEWIGQIHINER